MRTSTHARRLFMELSDFLSSGATAFVHTFFPLHDIWHGEKIQGSQSNKVTNGNLEQSGHPLIIQGYFISTYL